MTSFPYPSKIFKEKGITKKDAFENLINDLSTNGFKKYIISTVDRVIINREFEHTYFKSDGISNFYTEKERFECNTVDKKSPIEVWENIISKDVKGKSFSSYEELEHHIQDSYSHVYKPCNTFNPYIVGYFLLNFKGVESVLDPCAGWGDRLIGFLAAVSTVGAATLENFNKFSYTGFDPNYKLEDGYKKIIKDFGTKNCTAAVNILPFEDSILEENSFDMTLTSPPFFELEVYDATSSTQSIAKNKTYKEWIDNFYSTFLTKICFATRKYIVIYTANYRQYKLVEDTASIIEKCGKFKRVALRYFFNTTAGPKINLREIFVWERNSESSLVKGPNMILKEALASADESLLFPYHYYEYGSSVKESMYRKIKNCQIKFHNNTKDVYPQLIELKANQKIFEQSFLINNKNSFKEEGCGWKEDLVIDFYNEEARMKSTGYGYEKTPIQIWESQALRKEYGVSNREDFYTKQMEARLAYVSQSKGIFEYVGKTFFTDRKLSASKIPTIKVLDIAAYGDRMLAASSIDNYNFIYTGIDPNTDLKYDSLIQDITLFYNKHPVFFNTSFENFCLQNFDVVLVSPPPYKAEKYDLASDSQTHNMYPSFEQWVNGFLINTIIRKVATTYKPKIFAFTALDRLKGKKEQGYLISYVELFMYCITLLTDYEYHSTLQLNTSAGTPWFFFVLKQSSKTTPLLKSFFHTEYYRKIICDKSKIFQNMLLNRGVSDFLSSYYLEERKVEVVKNCTITYLTTKENLFINSAEKIRYEVVRYVCNILFENLDGKVPFNKLLTFFSRWLMGAASFCSPLERFLSCDIMFPDITGNEEAVKACGNQFIENVTEFLSIENIKEIVYTKYFLFESHSHFKEVAGPGLAGLVKTAGVFVYHTTLTSLNYLSTEGSKKYLPFTVKKTDTLFQESDPLPEKRYKALGAVGHHFTRPIKRAQILREALSEKVCVDLFATYKNSNSLGTPHYFSLYPDVEENSLGNVFYITFLEGGLYLANALDSKFFVEYTAKFLNQFLSRKGTEVTFVTSGVVWKDTVDFKNIEKYFETGDKEKIFKPSNFPTHPGFKIHSEINRQYIKAAFILDQTKFPSVEDPYEKDIRKATAVTSTRNQQMISFGIILSNKKKFTIDREVFGQIGDIGVYD